MAKQAKRKRKKPTAAVAESTGLSEKSVRSVMAALGRLGGKKKGKPKGFAKMDPAEVSKLGAKGAKKRWGS
jgi:hypothetical protein